LDEQRPPRPTSERRAELTTWAVVYIVLGWLGLIAAMFGGEGESPYFLVAGAVLLPLGLGFWFHWRWARWLGFVVFIGIAAWALWQLAHLRLKLLSIALLLMSVETLLCLRKWPQPRADESAP
jgi:MFS family permease